MGSTRRYPLASTGFGTVAPAPTSAGLRGGRYDATRCLYNAKPTNTLRLRAAVARARTGGVGRISTIGDSVTVGQTADPGVNDPITTLQRILRGRGIDVGETVYAYNGIDDARITFGGTWQAGAPDFPFAQYYNGAGGTLTYTSAAPGTVLELIVPGFQPAFDITIDGGAPITVTPTGGDWAQRFEVATGLAATVHTVVLTTPAEGAYVMSMGVRPAAGLVLANAAISGTHTAEWLSTVAYPGNVGALLSATTPDCVYLELMLADTWVAPTLTIAEHKANMATIIGMIQAADADIVLGVSNRTDVVDDAEYDTRIAAEYDLADQFDLPLLDFSECYGPYADHLDMAGDTVHLNALGSSVKAGLLAALIDP